MDLVGKIPGFISYKPFRADDGGVIAIARFETEEALDAWRHHPDHVAAQQRGKAEFYESYAIQICRTGVRRTPARRTPPAPALPSVPLLVASPRR